MTNPLPNHKLLWALEERFTSAEHQALDDRSVPIAVRKMYFKIRRAEKTYPDFVALLDNESMLDRRTMAYALLSAAEAALFLAKALVPGCTVPEHDPTTLAELTGQRALLLQTLAMLDPDSPEYEPEFAAAEGEHRRNAARATELGVEKLGVEKLDDQVRDEDDHWSLGGGNS